MRTHENLGISRKEILRWAKTPVRLVETPVEKAKTLSRIDRAAFFIAEDGSLRLESAAVYIRTLDLVDEFRPLDLAIEGTYVIGGIYCVGVSAVLYGHTVFAALACIEPRREELKEAVSWL